MLLPLALALVAAQVPPGPHAAQLAQFGHGPPLVPPHLVHAWTGPSAQLTKRVYGYLPGYAGVGVAQLRWDALTDVIIFSADVDSGSGAITVPSTWTQSAVDTAHQNGGRAHLCATLFGNSSVTSLLASSTARSAAISQLVSAVTNVNGDGVNIDFEFVTSSGKANFTQFITDLASALHAANPEAEVTIAMPAYPAWYPGYDVSALASAADRLLLMEYDWHWQGGPSAGPVAPLTAGSTWGTSDAEGMHAYLQLASADKLVMGVPYYGYDWPTSSETAINASTTANGAAVTYKNCGPNASTYGRQWDADSQTPWYHYSSGGTAHQTWYDDAQSLALKYDDVNQRGVAGIMIWALGYEGTDTQPGDLIIQKFGLVVSDTDAGQPDTDAGHPDTDAGHPDTDAGHPDTDAGQPDTDAGHPDTDAGHPDTDAGRPEQPEDVPAMVYGGCGSAGGFTLLGFLALGLLRRRR